LIDPKLRAPQTPFCLSIDRYYISPCPFLLPPILLVCAECGDGQKTVKDQDILMMNAGYSISAIAHLTLIFLGGNTPGALQVHQSIEKKNAEGLLFFCASP
jgi:hypothetical protein